MKLKIRYENEHQTLEVPADELWVSLSLEECVVKNAEEKEKIIQEEFDKQFNRPDYNNWHKFDRHRGNPKKPFRKNEDDDIDVWDSIPDNTQEDNRNSRYEYDEVCNRIRTALGKKKEWADMFIAVRIDGIPVREYAASIGVDENNITQKLKRAEKKLRELFENRQI